VLKQLTPHIISAAGVMAVCLAAVYFAVHRDAHVEVVLTDRGMRPALKAGMTRFAVDRSWTASPTRGTVVAFAPPGRDQTPTVTRAVAIPGDEVEVKDHLIRVNGTPASSSTRTSPAETIKKFRIPRGYVYLLTDRPDGPDSTTLGPLPLWRVLGSVK